MWSDNDTRIDFIDFNHLVSSVTSIISNDDLLPCTIGLYGDWGSGKSSLMQMVESHFEGDEGVLTIKFNGWLFEGYEDAKTVLMGTILDELIKNRTLGNKSKTLVTKLLRKIDWLKVATTGVKAGLGFLTMGPVGVSLAALDAGDVVKGMTDINYSDYIDNIKNGDEQSSSLRMGIREFHNDFSELLRETDVKRLIVFIDDLDRCNPHTVIDTLEAIKLFLFVENSAFVIGADERLIKYAVKKRFPEIPGEGRFEVGRDYLEKLIQFPIRIPQMSQSEMETYINLLFTNLHISNEEVFEDIRKGALEKKATDLFSSTYKLSTLSELVKNNPSISEEALNNTKESLTLSASISPILTQRLNGNPRQAKRFLNTLLLRIIMAEGNSIDLDKRVLAKLMILEYFKPEIFRKISSLQIGQNGKPNEVIQIEEFLSNEIQQDVDPKDKDSVGLSSNLESWLLDEDVKRWFSMEPFLSNVDLGPYFYFSRDNLGTMPAVIQRMSPLAQDVFSLVISDSGAQRKRGISKLDEINSSEASAIFEAVRDKFLENEATVDDESYLSILIDVCDKVSDLGSQLFLFLQDIPDSKIKTSIIPKLIKTFESGNFRNQLINQLRKWSNSGSNKGLAKIATGRINKIENNN